MNVPFFSLLRQNNLIIDKLTSAFTDVVQSEQFSGGSFVEKFETNLSNYFEGMHAVCVNSGTSALFLALLSLGIKEGDEVIVPVNTFIATVWAVIYLGAKPVFVDCGDDYNIDVNQIVNHINNKTKAIICVHLYGKPANLLKINQICSKYKLHLIEDCAQAFGALCNNTATKVGTYGDIGCFSFYPSKNLGAFGEGGMLLVKDKQLCDLLRVLRNQGSQKKYYFDAIGYNMRMDGIQAAILDSKLEFVDAWNNKRCEIATKYLNFINNSKVILPYKGIHSDSIYHLFVVLVEDREKFVDYLNKNQIGYGIHYPVCCHMQKALQHLNYKQGDFPVAEYAANHCVSLPMFPELENCEVDRIVEVINRY